MGQLSWKSFKQQIVANSTTKPEYVAVSEAIKEAIWMKKKFIMDLRVIPKIEGSVLLYCNNTRAIIQAKKSRSQYKSKHILRYFHLVKDKMLSWNE